MMAATGKPITIDMRDPAFWQDPYPLFAAARAAHRTARTSNGEPILLGADDIEAVLTDPELVQLGVGALERLGMHDGPFHAWRALAMAAHDGPVHERLRSTVGRAFTPRRVEPMRERLRAHANELVDETMPTGVIDIVTDYAHDLPLWLVCDFLGLPQSSRAEIGSFLAGTEEAFTDPLSAQGRQRAEDGIVALSAYAEGLIAERVETPAEDLVSDLLEAKAAGRLDHDELVAMVVNVIGGAVGSSRAAITNSLFLLLAHPEQAARVRNDPSQVPPAVEECLRFHPPFRLGRRKAVVSMDRFGLRLAEGDTVLLARQAANRDPSRWSEPDRFDVSRPVQRHYSFGYGPHFCLGQALARLDVQESVAAFLDRRPGARLVTEVPRRVPFTADEQIESLLVSIE